tara:strand:- start:6267 stop:6797 length:531 start_codon:yes stop_codon:yes gene_type:complete
MKFRFSKTALLIIAGLIFCPMPSIAEQSSSSSSYKVLAKENGLNLFTVRNLINKGDQSISEDDLTQAREHFDKARNLTKQLLVFYRDVNGAFRGIDARIPREMNTKAREAQVLLAKTNLRLASLFRRQKQPEIAVPLLIEVVKIMTPTKVEGQKAYQSLLELGFVETPFGIKTNED